MPTQPTSKPAPVPDFPMDPDFAAQLLDTTLHVITADWRDSQSAMPGWDGTKFESDLHSLRSRELPYFRWDLQVYFRII